MKKTLLIILLLTFGAISFVNGDEVLTDLIGTLTNHKDPEARRNAAVMLGTLKIKSSVKPLIDSLADDNEEVRNSAHKSLTKLTKQDFALDQEKWLNWWEQTGSELYSNIASNSLDLTRLKSYLNIAFIAMLLELIFILIFIIVFSFIGGAKIKEMKEINRRAEQYVTEADGVSKRFDNLFQEIEKKRVELAQYFVKLKEDNQGEIERFSDLTQQNIEHHLRESSRNLREKSENELKQTLSLLKEDVERLIKKVFAEQSDKLSAHVKQQNNPPN